MGLPVPPSDDPTDISLVMGGEFRLAPSSREGRREQDRHSCPRKEVQIHTALLFQSLINGSQHIADDQGLRGKLTISGLYSPLKAEEAPKLRYKLAE